MSWSRPLLLASSLLISGAIVAGDDLPDGLICNSPGLAFGGPGLPAQIVDTLEVAGQGAIQDIAVQVQITHTWVGDLRIDLVRGDDTVRLLDRLGEGAFGCSHDDVDAAFADAFPYSEVCSPTPPAVSGERQPWTALSMFEGLPADGGWDLRVTDVFPTDEDGVLEMWCLDFREGAISTPATSSGGAALLILVFLSVSWLAVRRLG